MTDKGWIKVHRRLVQNPLWAHLPAEWLKVWIGILFRANLEVSSYFDGSHEVHMKPGSLITSAEKLALYCNVTVKQVRGTLDYLERAGMVARSRASRYSVLSICNWGAYQHESSDEGSLEGALNGEEAAGSRETKGQRKGTERATDKELRTKNTPSGRFSADVKTQIEEVTSRLFERHPKRRSSSRDVIRKKLESICRSIPADDRLTKLQDIDATHGKWCLSWDWQKENGQYVKGISNWLSLDAKFFEITPDSEPAEPVRKRNMM